MKIYHIGNIIKGLVKSKNLTVIKFSQMMDMSATAVYDMYRKEDLNTSVLKKISNILDVPMTYWFGGETEIINLNEDMPKYGKKDFFIDQIKEKDKQIDFLQNFIIKKLEDEK